MSRDYVSQRERTYPGVNEDENAQKNSVIDNINLYIGQHSLSDLASNFTEDSLNLPFLTKLQNRILKMFYFDGLSYKEIAFRISGNRKGAYSCDAISWQIRLAKRRIIQFSSKVKGKKYGNTDYFSASQRNRARHKKASII